METIFLLIGVFLIGDRVDVRIIKNYGRPTPCIEAAADLNKKAEAEKKLYKFYCKPTSFTQA